MFFSSDISCQGVFADQCSGYILLSYAVQDKVILGSDYPFPLGEHKPGSLIQSTYKDNREIEVKIYDCTYCTCILQTSVEIVVKQKPM